jgi:hypothetical protein
VKDAGGYALKQSTNVRWLSLIELLESIDKSFTVLTKVLAGKKKLNINVDIVRSLIRLLRPFKSIIQLIQKSSEPSFHNVVVSVLTLRAALASAASLIEYEKSYEYASNLDGDLFDYDNDEFSELEGNEMFAKWLRVSKIKNLSSLMSLDRSLFVLYRRQSF